MCWSARSWSLAFASASASSFDQIGSSTLKLSSSPWLPEPADASSEPSGDAWMFASPWMSSLVSGFQPLTVTFLTIVDELSRGLGLAVHELTGALMLLEMKKIVRRLPGNMYERC